jgi:hypothetical protein
MVRKDLARLIEAAGGQSADTCTRYVDYLVTTENEVSNGTAKVNNARKVKTFNKNEENQTFNFMFSGKFRLFPNHIFKIVSNKRNFLNIINIFWKVQMKRKKLNNNFFWVVLIVSF